MLAETLALDPVHPCKRLFVQRQAVRSTPIPSGFDGPALRAALEHRFGRAADRESVRRLRRGLGEVRRHRSPRRSVALRLLGHADAGGRALHRGDTMFRVPHRIDPAHLVPVETIVRDGVTMLRCPNTTGGIVTASR